MGDDWFVLFLSDLFDGLGNEGFYSKCMQIMHLRQMLMTIFICRIFVKSVLSN